MSARCLFSVSSTGIVVTHFLVRRPFYFRPWEQSQAPPTAEIGLSESLSKTKLDTESGSVVPHVGLRTLRQFCIGILKGSVGLNTQLKQV